MTKEERKRVEFVTRQASLIARNLLQFNGVQFEEKTIMNVMNDVYISLMRVEFKKMKAKEAKDVNKNL